MDLQIKDHVFMISGGSRGIGFAIAERAAQEGARIAICARIESALQEAATSISEKTSGEILTVAADLREEKGIKAFADKTLERFGHVDALINCAGDAQNGDFLALPDEAWVGAWQLKVFGYVRLTRALLPMMRERSYGRVVNVIGYGGRQPLPTGMPAAMANAALLSFTKGISKYCAGSNILVNAVNPGVIRTGRWEKNAKIRAEAAGTSVEEFEASFTENTLLRRIGEPEEIAAVVVFLASPLASYVNGAYLDVDGGETGCF